MFLVLLALNKWLRQFQFTNFQAIYNKLKIIITNPVLTRDKAGNPDNEEPQVGLLRGFVSL